MQKKQRKKTETPIKKKSSKKSKILKCKEKKQRDETLKNIHYATKTLGI